MSENPRFTIPLTVTQRRQTIPLNVEQRGAASSGVTSVNGKTGAVSLNFDDIPNGQTYARTTPAQIQQITTNETAIQGKQNKITASGLLKGDGAGGVSEATPGTDYVPPSDYAPEAKTTAMTQPVGKDANGKLWTEPSGGGGVTDVQVNGTSVVQGGVANVPMASASTPGVVISGTVTVTGTTPTITAQPGVRYVCGEVATLDITLPASGIVDVTFESGSTATVLTITPPTGQTVRWANGFDPTALEANTVYNIRFTNGNLAVVTKWGESSGGGAEETFRKICDVTTEQDVASLTITKDMDGNSFKIKKWCAAVQIRSSDTSALGVIIRLGTQPNSTIFLDSIYGFNMSSPSSANKQNNYWACFEWVAGLNTWMPFGVMACDTNRNYGDQHTYPITPPVPYEWSYPPFATISERYMTAIKLIANSTDPTIGAGTRIQVWGVDA